MATTNAINTSIPVQPVNGGTGISSPTAHGVVIAEGASNMVSLVLAAGQLLIGTTAGDPVSALLTAGSGISITAASGSITISATGNTPWTDVTGTSQTMLNNNGYVADNASLVTLTLPSTANFGDEIKIVGKGAGGWLIAQNAGQSIKFGNVSTTAGVSGSIASTNANDCVNFVCTTANTTFTVRGSVGQNITYV